jgi:hypothetical protein
MIFKQISDFFQALTPYGWVGTVLLVAVALLAGVVLNHLAARLIRRVLTSDGNQLPFNTIFVNIARIAIWCVVASLVLEAGFGISATALVAALGIGGIALSLGLRDTIANLINGIQLSLAGVVHPGDCLEVAGTTGRVKDMTWRHTTLVDANGATTLIPNALMGTSAVTVLPNLAIIEVPFVLPASLVARPDFASLASNIAQAAHEAAKQQAPLCGEVQVIFEAISPINGTAGITAHLTIPVPRDTPAVPLTHAITQAIAPLLITAPCLVNRECSTNL